MDCIIVTEKNYNSLRGPLKVAIFSHVLWSSVYPSHFVRNSNSHHYFVSHQEAPPQHTPFCLPTAVNTSAQSLWIFWPHSHHNIELWWKKSIHLSESLNKKQTPTVLTSVWIFWIMPLTIVLLLILLFIQCGFFILSLFFEIIPECLQFCIRLFEMVLVSQHI